MNICSFRWVASRLDVPGSTPVTHVCRLEQPHADRSPHVCTCGLVHVSYVVRQ